MDSEPVDTPSAPRARTQPGSSHGWAAGPFRRCGLKVTLGGCLSRSVTVIQLVSAALHQRQRWPAGNGASSLLAQAETGGPGVAPGWRAAVDEIGRDGALPDAEGGERELLLLGGLGMHLNAEDGCALDGLQPPRGRCRLSAGPAPRLRLIEGPVRVFDLVWQPQAFDAQLLHRPLVGAMLFFGEPGVTWLLYLLAGQATTPEGPLQQGDAALLRADSGRCVISGGGELVLARLSRRAPG